MTQEIKNHIAYWLNHFPFPPAEDIAEMYDVSEEEVKEIARG